MAERKKTTGGGDDVGQAEAQKIADRNEEKGHIGDKPGPYDNSAFSLASGPDSPSAAEQTAASLATIAEQSAASARKGDA